MKYYLLLTLGVLFTVLSYGQKQTTKIDSLLIELNNAEDVETSNILLQLATEYSGLDSFATGISYFKKSLLLAEKHKQTEILAAANYQLGTLYNQLEDVTNAQEHFIKCYNLSEKYKYYTLLVYSSAGLGNVYIKTEDWPAAIKHINKSLTIAKKNKLKNDIPKFYNLIGIVYLNNNQIDSALLYFRKLLDAGLELKDSFLIGCAYNNMADAHIKRGSYVEAIALLDKSHRINIVKSQQEAVASILSNKGESYLKLRKYDEALKCLIESNTIAKSQGYLAIQKTTYKNISDLYHETGNFQLSLENYKLYITCKDSIFNIEKQKQINNLKTRSHQEQIEEQLKVSEQKAMNRSIIIFFTIISTVLLIVIFIQIYRRFQLKIRMQEIERSKMVGTIDEKNRELASIAMSLGQKKMLISQVEESVKNINNSLDNLKIEEFLSEIKEKFRSDNYLENNWELFLRHFNSVHPMFFTKLQEKYPELTSNDLKHCAFIKLKLGVKEVALINNITSNSVYMIRYRLKIKLNLPIDQDISTFIIQF